MTKIKKAFFSFLEFSHSLVKKIEESKTPFYYFLFFFLIIVSIRNFLENFPSDQSPISFNAHLHFYLFYVFVFSGALLLFTFFTKTKVVKSFKVFSLYFSVVLLGMIVDLIVYGFGGTSVSYIFLESFEDLKGSFLSFFGSFDDSETTLGIQLHLFIFIALFVYYVFLKTRSVIKCLISGVVFYSFLFLAFISPYLINFFDFEVESFHGRDIVFFFSILSSIFVTFLFYLSRKRTFLIAFKDIRFLRLGYFLLIFALGLAFGYKEFSISFYEIIMPALILSISIVFAWSFSVITNNFADYEIDKVSNKKRPLFDDDISIEEYKTVALFSLLMSLISAAVVHYFAFFYCVLFIGIYFIYSMPPVRFKRVPVLSKLAISLNSFIVFVLGVHVFVMNVPYVSSNYIMDFVPERYILFFLVFFTLAANFIDIKDYEGDKKEGIKTLPVLLGLERAKTVIALFFSLPYLYVAYIYPETIPGCLLFIVINTFLIKRKNYRDGTLLFSCLLSILLFLFFHLNYLTPPFNLLDFFI